ncbi:hypothetical protein BIW11_03943 [Tropilaelaps mercedesae]|uniref:SAM domain-containing protein n=1 Tax=Tropilaelaps mercedesae TaxID=418985 RepID=A0A1V9XDG8_9ACAR|nr:hypothetical protein BIW11_03943 [Tropilaelaps mercedesae]
MARTVVDMIDTRLRCLTNFNSTSPFSPATPPVRPPALRSPDSPAGRLLTGVHLSPRSGAEGQRSSPLSQPPLQAPGSPHSSQRSPAAGFNLADFSSSQTLLNLVRTAQSSQLETYLKGAVKRPASSTQEGDPLDLSLSGPPVKRLRSPVSPTSLSSSPGSPRAKEASLSMGGGLLASRPRSHSPRCSSACANEEHRSLVVSRWTVDEVVSFVQAIDACAPYAEKFREQSIDGSILSALTEDHLTAYMGMRLGPALKLRQSLAKKMGHCSVCLHCLHCHGPSPAAQLSTASHPALPAHDPTDSPVHSAGSPSPRSSPLAVTSLDALLSANTGTTKTRQRNGTRENVRRQIRSRRTTYEKKTRHHWIGGGEWKTSPPDYLVRTPKPSWPVGLVVLAAQMSPQQSPTQLRHRMNESPSTRNSTGGDSVSDALVGWLPEDQRKSTNTAAGAQERRIYSGNVDTRRNDGDNCAGGDERRGIVRAFRACEAWRWSCNLAWSCDEVRHHRQCPSTSSPRGAFAQWLAGRTYLHDGRSLESGDTPTTIIDQGLPSRSPSKVYEALRSLRAGFTRHRRRRTPKRVITPSYERHTILVYTNLIYLRCSPGSPLEMWVRFFTLRSSATRSCSQTRVRRAGTFLYKRTSAGK